MHTCACMYMFLRMDIKKWSLDPVPGFVHSLFSDHCLSTGLPVSVLPATYSTSCFTWIFLKLRSYHHHTWGSWLAPYCPHRGVPTPFQLDQCLSWSHCFSFSPVISHVMPCSTTYHHVQLLLLPTILSVCTYWVCCSFYLECPSFPLSAKFGFILLPSSVKLSLPTPPQLITPYSATFELSSISFVVYECIYILEIQIFMSVFPIK